MHSLKTLAKLGSIYVVKCLLQFFFFFKTDSLCSIGWSGTNHLNQAALKLRAEIRLPLPFLSEIKALRHHHSISHRFK